MRAGGGPGGFEYIEFRRTTVTCSNGQAVQNLILMTLRGGHPLRLVLIENSDIGPADVAILFEFAANDDTYPLRGEGENALAI